MTMSIIRYSISSKDDNVSISHSVNSIYVKSNSALYYFIMFIIYIKERKTVVTTHTHHRSKLLTSIYIVTLIYKYIHTREKNDMNI